MRRTPLKRRRTKPRRVAARCTRRGCKRHPLPIGLCRTHARLECDRLMGALVRSRGRCEVCGATSSLQWAHGFSRRYLAVRYEPLNSWCLCYKCHFRYTHDTLRWDQVMRETLGELVYEEMRGKALRSSEPPDYAEILGRLRAVEVPGGV